ncbi:MAG: coenzyme F420-0:L-glutamate ligase [Candidatus Hodarchaeales archaeon]|jgi:coenzyme F420-0:L-glutamate ligase/coenzyme F420-1:gamma-L-glutamate ligase
MITIQPVENFPFIKEGDSVGKIIAENVSTFLRDGDVIVVTHKIVSRAEGKTVHLKDVKPSFFAREFAKKSDKDPRSVEVVLQETKSVVRNSELHLITETHHGFICANSGVDKSNSPGETVITLPDDPDKSASKIMKTVREITGKKVAVIITDTFGRIFRVGTTNIAIGVAGMIALESFIGKKDLFNYEMKTTQVARADELAAAAGLVAGQTNEGYPVVIISGFKYSTGLGDIQSLLRTKEQSLFW